MTMEPALEVDRGGPISPKPKPHHKRRPHRAIKPQLLTRDHLDQRSNAAKLFDRLASAIQADLGGRDQLTAVELALIEGFAGAAVVLEDLNTRIALGEKVDFQSHALACSSLVRIAAKIGVSRKARLVNGLIEAEAGVGAVVAAPSSHTRRSCGSAAPKARRGC
jgi:hypothetical protein